MILSGVEGCNAAINVLYSPVQETGRDGRKLYRRSGESGPEALCIEHYKWQWQVKNEMDRGSGVCCAFAPGNCAFNNCQAHEWTVVCNREFVHHSSVTIVAVAEAA
jgi:hypothetical protein